MPSASTISAPQINFNDNGLGRHVRAYETGERTPIGDCQRCVAQRLGSLDQFFWM